MKLSVYLETTIPSYLTARSSRDIIIAGHQQITRDWWEVRHKFELHISQLVIDEAGAGDAEAARERLKMLRDLPLLDVIPEVGDLTSWILESGKIPNKASADAVHIAVAAVYRMDFLLTWNCAHIANAVIAKSIAGVCSSHGYKCPAICTPEELMGE
jgi:hypothetical protein